MAGRVYVGNLALKVVERDLEEEFGRFGTLKSVWVARKPPGFAFVDFDDARDANDAVRKMDGFQGWRVELSRRGPGGGPGPRGRSPYRRRERSPRRRPRSPSYERRRRSPSYEPRRRRSPSYEPRRRRSPSYEPRPRRSPSYDQPRRRSPSLSPRRRSLSPVAKRSRSRT